MRPFLVLLSLLLSGAAHAQIQFTSCPRDMALIPRNVTTNKGSLDISGLVTDPNYNRLEITLYKAGVKLGTQTISLVFSGGQALFSYKTLLTAGRFNYDIKIALLGLGSWTKNISKVVVGDVYIVQGQSNAVANSYNGLANPKYYDTFLRSYGSSTTNGALCAADTAWNYVNGDFYYNKGCIGQWALVMAKRLLDTFGIPIAIVNGAVGGTYVSQHQRYNPQPENLGTIYGRLLYRMKKAGIAGNVRSILFFQGESDGSQGKKHDSLFRILYADWRKDYKGMQQNYLVQVRGGGCGNPSAAMLEYQRQFEYSLPKMRVISSNGLNGHDGCHYWLSLGYELLGKQFSYLLARDLYGSARKTNVNPPSVARVFYNNAAHTEVVLEMRDPADSVLVDPLFHPLFFLTGDPAVMITAGKLVKNRVYLTLNQATCKKLSLSYMGRSGNQPWVKNNLLMGLIGFHLIPIEVPTVKSVYSGCPGKPTLLGEDSIPGYKYLWKNALSGKSGTTARISTSSFNDETWTLMRTNAVSGCSKDTFKVLAIVDKALAPELGQDTVLCAGASLKLELPALNGQKCWYVNGKAAGCWPTLNVGDPAWVRVETISELGCPGKDSILISYSYPKVHLELPEYLCKGTDTLLSVPGQWQAVYWNNDPANNAAFLRTGAGKVVLNVMDTANCEASDTGVILEYPDIHMPDQTHALCSRESVLISHPPEFIGWAMGEEVMEDTIEFSFPETYEMRLVDTNACESYTKIIIQEKPTPEFSLGGDHNICQGGSHTFTCSAQVLKYIWNGKVSYSNTFTDNTEGPVTCSVTNSVGCSWSDSSYLHVEALPEWTYSKDTTLCNGASWSITFLGPQSYFHKGKRLDSFNISAAGMYILDMENAAGCKSQAEIRVAYKQCVSGWNAADPRAVNARLWPNPAAGLLHLEFITWQTSLEIYDNAGKLVRKLEPCQSMDIDISDLAPGIYEIHSPEFSMRFLRSE